MSARGRAARALALAPLLAVVACAEQSLDAGMDMTGALPVGVHDPVLISNDGCGSWQGLYAVLFANSGGPPLAGVAVNASAYATNLEGNLAAWQNLVAAGRASGLRNLPDPVVSDGPPLVRPASGDLASTVANGSAGARLIVEVSSRVASRARPLAVVVGGRLTDVADAYLLDRTVADRVVVVADVGALSATGAVMGAPNGELDPWADWIVAQKFRYVQVSAYYDETTDIPAERLDTLPDNPLGQLIETQQPGVSNVPTMSDQIALLPVGVPSFVTSVQRVSLDPAAVFDATVGPPLVADPTGHVWLVTGIDPGAAITRLWDMLKNPGTFGG